jgi:hypothetical protein
VFFVSCGYHKTENKIKSVDIEHCQNVERLIADTNANWQLNFDTIPTIDDFILAQRRLFRNNQWNLHPYIITDEGQTLYLNKIRTPRGSGYMWDCRAIFNISYYDTITCDISWDKSSLTCLDPKSISRKVKINELNDNIIEFYESNYYIEHYYNPIIDTPSLISNEIEICLTPMDDKTSLITHYIQIITESYLQFQNEQAKSIFGKDICDLNKENIDSLKKIIPLRISISARYDENRHKRIIDIENNGW